MRVAVVGGGVIGLGVAYELARAGAMVTVLERDRLGSGASSGNAGWITPALSALPLPAPGVIGQALRWMLHGDSPLLLRPRLDPELISWLWSFRLACSSAAFAAGAKAMVGLSRLAGDGLLHWRDEGVRFELWQAGVLFAARTHEALKHEKEQYVRLSGLGLPIDHHLLSGQEARHMEPALSEDVVGALLSPGEWHVRPESLIEGLAAALGPHGARVIEGARVLALAPHGGTWRIATAKGPFESDRVILACGAWLPELLNPLGYRLPMQAAKGYSMTCSGEGQVPHHAINLLEAKVACSPYERAVRLAGTLELGGHANSSIDRQRIAAVARAATDYLRWQPAPPVAEWAGLRPLTPDGLPVIGALPGCEGLFISTGHGMAGMTLAAPSAGLLAQLVLKEREPNVLRPFSPLRFAGARGWMTAGGGQR